MNTATHTTDSNGLTILTLGGDLTDVSGIAAAVNAVAAIIADCGDVMVDIRNVTTMGRGGLATMIALNAAVPRFGGAFSVRITPGPVANLLNLIRGCRPETIG